ncbi:MAG TPA: sugar ABC transporter permease, partial [Microbacterium sp.]|nr:sugar ABC transporter permease [Microbacterium sp.]
MGGLIIKIICLGVIAALAFMLTPPLVSSGQWVFLAVIWGIVLVVVVVYATKRFLPAKYLLPGTLLLVLFVVYPVILTFQLSATNYGDGTRTTKEVSISRIIANSAVQVEGARTFELTVGSEGASTSGPYTFLLVDTETGDVYAGTPEGLDELDPDAVTVEDGVITAADGYTILSRAEVNELSQSGGPLEGFAVPTEDGVITAQGFSAVELSSPLEYDEATDTITNTETGVEYTPVQTGDRKYFTSADGERLSDLSWGEDVGFDNYIRVFTDPTISRDFIGIFIWTLVFATVSVAATFALGLALATVLNDPRLRGQKLFRSV